MLKVLFSIVVSCVVPFTTAHAQMALRVDARDIERSLIHATATLPVSPGNLDLFYVEWVPGNHNPSGPVWNIVDFFARDSSGNTLRWDRDPKHVTRITVSVPDGVESIQLSYTYIANQPWVYSESSDSYGRPGYGGMNWNSLLWYPGNADKNTFLVEPHLTLPPGWKIATDLPLLDSKNGNYHFEIVSLAQLVDSPIVFGKPDQLRTVTLDDGDKNTKHYFHGVALEPEHLDLPAARIEKLNEFLKQTHIVFGAYPHDEFHFLGLLGDFPGLGLEHTMSTYFDMDDDEWTACEEPNGSSMGVVPHEYIHVWCGKLRSPKGLLTTNYHTPADPELMWVYEGLTSYYGPIVSVRSELTTPEDFVQRVQGQLFRYDTQSGRSWRSVQDTARGLRHLRAPQKKWIEKIRRQDYYSEGALFWMYADATIRLGTNNAKSLDDFCKQFFDVEFVSFGSPVEYDRDEIVATLSSIYPDADWNALIRRYIETPASTITDDLPALLGYTMIETKEPSDALTSQEKRRKSEHRTLLLHTLGIYPNKDGEIRTLLAHTPADKAGLAYDMKILAVNGESFSRSTLAKAVKTSAERGSIELLVEYYSKVWTIQIPYHSGPSYPTLKRAEQTMDVLGSIMEPR